MSKPIQRSRRFTKAARAERDRLARRRSRLFKQREELQARIDKLDEDLEAVDREILLIEDIAMAPEESDEVAIKRSEGEQDPNLLKGFEIRATAIPLLLREQGTAPIHYRGWLELLTCHGYVVAGKRPDAVFLNQVTRSPLVRATTKSGYYAIDLAVVDQLREKLRRQQTELADLIREAPVEIGEAFDQHRKRQRELNIEIGRTERELDEALGAIRLWKRREDSGVAQAQAA
jgi:hypothetical protein